MACTKKAMASEEILNFTQKHVLRKNKLTGHCTSPASLLQPFSCLRCHLVSVFVIYAYPEQGQHLVELFKVDGRIFCSMFKIKSLQTTVNKFLHYVAEFIPPRDTTEHDPSCD